MSLELWKNEVTDYIPKIIDSDVTEKNAQLLASLFVLKQHFDKMDKESIVIDEKTSQIGEYEVTDDEDYKTWLLDNIKEELNASEMYLNKFRETKVNDFKDIAMQELKHSEILLRIIKEKYPNADIQELKIWHHAILAKIL